LSSGQQKIRDDIISHMHFYGGHEEMKAAKKSIEKEVLDNIEAKATWAEIKAIAERVEFQYPNVCSFAPHGIHEEEEAKSLPWPEPRTSFTKFRDLIDKKMVVLDEHESVRKRVAEEAEKIQVEEFDKQTLNKFAASIAQKMASEFPRKVIHLKEFNH